MHPDHALVDAEAERAVAELGLPPCPAVLARLMRELRADEPDFGAAGELIASDVALAAAMLKTVNSPLFALRRPAQTVREALALLGLRKAAQMVTGLLLRQAFPAGDNLLLERFWRTSGAVAAGASRLARESGAADPQTAWTYGLFRDCGMAVMACRHPCYADLLRGEPRGAGSVTDTENGRYAMNHARIGCQLARSWLLPEPVCLAVLHHHDHAAIAGQRAAIGIEALRLIALGMLAEHLHAPLPAPLAEAAMARLGVAPERLAALAD